MGQSPHPQSLSRTPSRRDGAAADARVSPAHPREARALCAHLLGRQLARILRLVDLEVGGQAVHPEAFALGARATDRPSPSGGPPVRYETLPGFSGHEPRLDVIHNGLHRALRLGRFRQNAGALAVDGFRLKNLLRWANYPCATLADNLGSISSYCNCDCDFCYERGTRRSGIARGRSQLSLREVDTRIRHHSPDKRTGLPVSMRPYLEAFANPRCLDILERLRKAAPTEFIALNTNASCLTEDVVARLSRLRPIGLGISLNAATPEWRQCAMRDAGPDGATTALASPALLRKYEIPFVAGYVPWPSRPLSDMEQAIRLWDRHDALMARIALPSWTRFAAQRPPFDTAEYWGEILAVVDRLRQEVQMPLWTMPAMYSLPTMQPVVAGTIRHSPAAQAGLKYGDLIVAVEGEAVFTRPEVTHWLTARLGDPNIRATRFTVERNDRHIEIEVPHPRDLEALAYPYRHVDQSDTGWRWGGLLGLYLPDGFELASFVRLTEIVGEYAGRRVLFFISELAQPHFLEGMTMLGEPAASVDRAEFHVDTLRPHYWGGNLIMGDLWTVQDLIEQTASWIERHGLRPDVVVVPGTFLRPGGRDLRGHCYLEFERALDIELRLLRCSVIRL